MYELPKLSPDEILIYLRKSRTDDATLTVEEVLAKHEQMLDEWVERNLPGLGKVPEANRFREVVSGETIDSRPAVLEVLRLVESPEYKAIVIVEPQRLSRGDLEDIGRLVKLLRYSNTLVITLQYTYDLRDERDRDSFERELKRGNEFLEYQKRILNNGRLLSVQNGNYVGQKAPYGYKKAIIKEGKKKCHTLEPDPNEAPVVKLVFDLYKQGNGVSRIIDKLMELGIRSPQGTIWAPTTIRTMLSNEHYIGKVRWYHKRTIKSVQDGRVIERRPIAEEYLVFPGKHPAIVDIETWDAVQAIRGKMPRNKKAGNLSNVLAGLLFCSCGKALKRHSYIVKGVERAAARYNCPETKWCGNASCTCAEILDEVKRVLSEAIEDFEIRVEKGTDNSVEVHRQLVARLERRLSDLETLEESQWEKYTLEGMPKNIFEKLNEKVLTEKAEVQQALCTAKDSIPEPIDFEEKITTFRLALELLNSPDAPIKEVNMLLKSCIERITYSRPKTHGKHARWGTDSPIELDIKLKV